jgi:hypothetical protein
VSFLAQSNHPCATTLFLTAGSGALRSWDGSAFWTYVGSEFDSYDLGQQETAAIHEMSHPYTGSNTIPDSASSEYTNSNIATQGKTEVPR